MRRPEFIARQSACPSGLLGWVIGHVMSHETTALNDAALAALAPAADDRVIEIGFGHGRTIERLAAVPVAFVAGLDVSSDMVRMATARCHRAIREGRVAVAQGDSASIPYPATSFTKALSVHTLYFWDDPQLHLREMHRVLCRGGRCVLGFRPKGAAGTADFPEAVYRFLATEEVVAALEAAGFEDVCATALTDETIVVQGRRR